MRAFVVRFGTYVTVGALGLGVFALFFELRRPLWALIVLVVAGGVLAVAGVVTDDLDGVRTVDGRDARTWKQMMGLDRDVNRRRRQQRRFGNSAAAGGLWIVGGLVWLSLYWATGLDTGWIYILTSLAVFMGVRLVWAGFRRWRTGGEFNLPGRAGPVLREPPRETRGD